MELKDLKALLSIDQVLQHYGLKPDRNHRLLCPFHADKTPSLQIYPKNGKNIECDPLLPIQIDPSKMGSEVRERKVLIAYSN